MNFPRVTAVLFLLLLIGGLSLMCIGTLHLLAPSYSYGSNVEHMKGEIVQMEENRSGMDFVLETANRQLIHFQCASLCHASPLHIERHLREHAETDVYYVEQPGNSLLAVDVD
ncbi:MAG: hypothetical protein ACYDER_19860 [Ktedonobacteraceae bacterium]